MGDTSLARAVDKAYDVIRKAVLQGGFEIGSRLKENELAESIGVSRTPVREALRRLNAEGLIDFKSNHRATVAHWSEQNVEDLFRLRAMLEGLATALAAERISDSHIQRLTILAEKMEALLDSKRRIDLDRISQFNNEFHKIVLEAANSSRLQTLMAGLIEMTIILRTYQRYSKAELNRSFSHHRELIAAFMAKDPEWARAVMTAHILAARATYMQPRRNKPPQQNEKTGIARRRASTTPHN
jgi:DNA-binding GntR family transcriptional regulator